MNRDYLVDVPEYEGRTMKVEKFSIPKKDAEFFNLKMSLSFGPKRYVKEGDYTRLIVNGELMMSDTPAEVREHHAPINRQGETALINGLGIGVVVNGLLMRPEVRHVTVVELNQEVVDHVGQHYLAKYGEERLTIHCANAFEWTPPKGTVYDIVWHDIWPTISTDNLKEYSKLNRRYARRSQWQGAWMQEWLRYEKRREQRQRWY